MKNYPNALRDEDNHDHSMGSTTPTPQMPKPDYIGLESRNPSEPQYAAYYIRNGTTTIEQFAQEKADRVEELEKALRAIKKHQEVSCPVGHQLSTTWNIANNYLTNPGEKGAEG